MNTESDRELLELAAKDSGVEASRLPPSPRDSLDVAPACAPPWNPLTDDGDALRLAAKLDMMVSVNRVDGFTEVACGYSNADLVNIREPHGDIYAATRRAIVRAAAEIGRAK